MGRNGKLRFWSTSFFKSSSAGKELPPPDYVCPISKSLMFDPCIVSSGQTFEGLCVKVCKDLGFTPTLADGARPDFSTVIPNLALKNLIVNWCLKTGSERPTPPVYSQVESILRSANRESPRNLYHSSNSEKVLLEGVPENPPVLFSHADTELNPRNLYHSSSSEESVIANSFAKLPFATRPSCLSSPSSPSSRSEFVSNEELSCNGSSTCTGEDRDFVEKMESLDVYEQEQSLILLRKTTKDNEESRTSLCTDKLLLALKHLLSSRYAAVQTNAAAALVNISLQKCNKIKIMRAGVVPSLIDVLRNGFEEAREHAAGAIFSLAQEDANKTAVGVLGAIEPLLYELRSGTRRSREDSAHALYHLTLMQSNRMRLVKLGVIPALLGLLKDGTVAARVVLVVCNLAAGEEGKAALLDAKAVECLVALLRSGSEVSSVSTLENCVAALHWLSDESLRFKVVARDSGAVEVLLAVAEMGSVRAREKAKRILEVLRVPETAEEVADVDWDAVMKGGVTRARHRVPNSPNSTDF